MSCYLENKNKEDCCGCEACAQICPVKAIEMKCDDEKFKYPHINSEKCINCSLCINTCPLKNMPPKNTTKQKAYGGFAKEEKIRYESTSGGAFSVIAEAFCDKNYVIFGAKADGKKVYHTYVENIDEISIFRKSKYSQSIINNSYKEVKEFLKKGKKVLFSGTPCQIAGLTNYLKNIDTNNLLTIEVICEGVPSPLYIDKYEEHLNKKYKSTIKELDYRNKDEHKIFKYKYGKWDFQVMKIILNNHKKIKKDRWINPFWNIWLNHLMSRPSCYECKFTTSDRISDITLGDLWGVHLYCPELYKNNGGSSLIISNTNKGTLYLDKAKEKMYGHELSLEEAIKYQSPLRKCIDKNENRKDFMEDLKNPKINYKVLIKKWYQKPSVKLLWSKYVWGNRQKVFFWNLKNRRGDKNE